MENFQPLKDLLNSLLNDEEIEVSDVHQCLFLIEKLESQDRTKKFAIPNNLRVVMHEDE